MSVPTYTPSHSLSTKSRELKRNLFVWSLRHYGHHGLLGGLRLQARNKVTISTLYRWIQLTLTYGEPKNCWVDPVLVEPIPFHLYWVKVDDPEANPFTYIVTRDRTILSPMTDETLLLPGDLGVCQQDPDARMQFPDPATSMFELDEDEEMAEVETKYSLSNNDPRKKALERDGRCVLTHTDNTQGHLITTWIYHPLLGIEISCDDDEEETDLTQYLNVTNALTLWQSRVSGGRQRDTRLNVY